MLATEFIPAQVNDSKSLLLVLHGLGDSMAGYRFLPGELRLPWMNYLLVNAPDNYFGGYSWYDFAGDADPGVKRSRRMLAELLDQQRSKGFPSEQTGLFGFSQGCLMTMEVGCRYPHRLAGLVGISGYLHEAETLVKELSPVAKEQSFLFTTGVMDPLIPFDEVSAQIEFLKEQGINVEWHTFVKGHTISEGEEWEVIRRFLTRAFGQK